MSGFGIGVVTRYGRHELGFIEVNTRFFEHFIDRLDGFGGHHGGGAHFINL